MINEEIDNVSKFLFRRTKEEKKGNTNLKKLTIILDKYIIYNQDFEILICRICKINVTGVHRYFARNHQVEIPSKNHQEIYRQVHRKLDFTISQTYAYSNRRN